MGIKTTNHQFNVQIYYFNYYELKENNWKIKPMLNEAQDALPDWRRILLRLIDSGQMLHIAPYSILKQAFNDFQRSQAPTWQKIVTSFLSKDSIISPCI